MKFFKKLTSNKQKGDYGEKKASGYLRRRGYRILERNHRNKFCEIDIIAQKKDVIVFIEVKSRTDDTCGFAAEAVDKRRRRRLSRAATYYMSTHKLDMQFRFDIIEVYFSDGSINHYENAFYYTEG